MSNKVKQTVKNLIIKLFATQGYTLSRTGAEKNFGTMESAFRAIAKRKHSFNTVIDVGASNGSWTRAFMKYFPLCQYLLIEAQPVHEKTLWQFANEHENVRFVLAAAGENPGQIYFDNSDPFGGQASHTPFLSNNIQVPLIAIDSEIQVGKETGPFLIKLDTHGFEVPILKGAFKTLTDTEILIIECYNFKIAPECLLFFEMCDYMKGLGFRCIDIVDPLHRLYDGSFWQMDIVFVKNNRPEFSYLEYK